MGWLRRAVLRADTCVMDFRRLSTVLLCLVGCVALTGCLGGEKPREYESVSFRVRLEQAQPDDAESWALPIDTDITLHFSERDAAALGATETVFPLRYETTYFAETRAGTPVSFETDRRLPEGPCFEDDVVVRSPDRDDFVAFPAGYCIGTEWQVDVPGYYDS